MNIGHANGINISADGTIVYIAATTERAIRVFAREPGSGRLTPQRTIPVGSFPDNIEVEGGNLLVASQLKGFTFLAHSRNADTPAPSQVLKVSPKGSGDYEVDELYVDDGSAINAATVAAGFKGGMLLGQSKDKRNHVLICKDAAAAPKR
jgi:hypothetical protein